MNDLNYNAGMSSYQFVNSLASCYGNQGLGRTGTPVHQLGHPGLPTSGTDYNPNATASYPNTCYSLSQVGHHYPQHPYATPAAGAHMQPQAIIDYTQLHPQRLGSTASHMHQHSNHSPGALSPNLISTPTSQTASASCKFADSTSSTGVASPQDLSTSSGPGRTSPEFGIVGPNPGGTSTKLGLTTPIASPVEHKANINQNISSSSSNENNEANNASSSTKNTKSANAQANPPQIYPWMKRVHLGQSKYLILINNGR